MEEQGATPTPPATPQPAPGPGFGERIHEFESSLPTLNEAFSNIASFVPGFAGYKSQDERRNVDKQLRALICERLSKVKPRLDGVVDSLSRAGTLDGLALVDQSGRRLSRLIDRMRF